MTCCPWRLASVAALVAMTGCAELPTESESTATEELSVLSWTADTPMASANALYEPAIAALEDFAIEVYPDLSIQEPGYLYWGRTFDGNRWDDSTLQLSPRASTSAQPTLVAFNGLIYLFYASGVDQYMARLNPVTFRWTGSTRLPFTSLGAVGAVVYNGSLTIMRVDPGTHQLMMRTMSTAEVFSAEQPVIYNTAASDPCQSIIIITFPGGPSVAAPSAPAAPAASPDLVIGFNVNEVTSSTPALAVAGTCLYMAHRDGTSNTLVYNTLKNGSWGPQRVITSGPGGAAQTSAVQPAMANFNGTLHLVHIGPNSTYGDIFWTTYNFTSGGWSAPLSIPNHQSQGTPSLTVQFNKLLMVHEGHSNGSSNLWHSTFTP